MDTIHTIVCAGCGKTVEAQARHICYGRVTLNEVTILMDGKPTVFRRIKSAWKE